MNKQVILFESFPDFHGSSLALYNAISKEYADKYDLIWYSNLKTDKYKTVNDVKKVISRTKLILESNRYIKNKLNNDSFRIHLRHGLSLKNCIDYYNNIGNLNAIITTSEYMMNIDSKNYPSSISDKFIITGLPSNDLIFNGFDIYSTDFIKRITGQDKRFSKIVIWLPTFRCRNNNSWKVGKVGNYGVPILKSDKEILELNNILVQNDILLLTQTHHVQKNYIPKNRFPNVSNIKIVSDDIKLQTGITTHHIMAFSDALITDYSSAYYEYMITEKPIGLTIDDFDEYNKHPGFFVDYKKLIKGDYISTFNDLCNFLINVKNGIDNSKTIRDISRKLIHKYVDNKSTERVMNYLKDNSMI